MSDGVKKKWKLLKKNRNNNEQESHIEQSLRSYNTKSTTMTNNDSIIDALIEQGKNSNDVEKKLEFHDMTNNNNNTDANSVNSFLNDDFVAKNDANLIFENEKTSNSVAFQKSERNECPYCISVIKHFNKNQICVLLNKKK